MQARLHKARGNLHRELWTLWEELQPVSTTAVPDYVDVTVHDVRRVLPDETYTLPRNVVVLQETGEPRRLLGIWIGTFESEAILILLSRTETERPLTYACAGRLLRAAGAEPREVRINRLAGETYFAEVVLRSADDQERVVDARPSDAIALALEAGAPIRVAEAVMREASQPSDAGFAIEPAGPRVLGKREILEEMERLRVRGEAERQQARAASRERRARHQGA